MLLSCHTIGMTTRTLVVSMHRFLVIFLFQDVSTVKKRTWSNQDIQARSLVLTTVAPTRVRVIKFHMYKYHVIWHLHIFSCRSRTVVDSFSGLMDPSWSIDKFFFSRMIGMILLRYGLSNVGFLRYQISHYSRRCFLAGSPQRSPFVIDCRAFFHLLMKYSLHLWKVQSMIPEIGKAF
jgi:hypothetical protein